MCDTRPLTAETKREIDLAVKEFAAHREHLCRQAILALLSKTLSPDVARDRYDTFVARFRKVFHESPQLAERDVLRQTAPHPCSDAAIG